MLLKSCHSLAIHSLFIFPRVSRILARRLRRLAIVGGALRAPPNIFACIPGARSARVVVVSLLQATLPPSASSFCTLPFCKSAVFPSLPFPPPAKEKTAPQDPIFVAPTKVKVLKHASTHKNGPFFDGLFLFHSDDFVVLGFVVFDFVSLPFIARNEPKNGPKIDPQWSPQWAPKWARDQAQNGPNAGPKMAPKTAPKCAQNGPKTEPEIDPHWVLKMARPLRNFPVACLKTLLQTRPGC